MALTRFVPGVATSFSTQLNNNTYEGLIQNGLSSIRFLLNGTITYGAGQTDGWGEAYIDSNGRMDSVSANTALFLTNKYIPQTNNTEAHGVALATSSSRSTACGERIYNKTSNNLFLVSVTKVDAGVTATTARLRSDADVDIATATFSGTTATFSTAPALSPSTNYRVVVDSGGSAYGYKYKNGASTYPYSGTTINWTTAIDNVSPTTLDVYAISSLVVASVAPSYTVTHTLPSGTFTSTISSAIGVPMLSNWESGADIKYKLTNTVEDTGWLASSNTPSISSFTAFTSQPTSLIVQLIPKNLPTVNTPGLLGFWVRAVN